MSKKDLLIQTSLKLFCFEGFNKTGIDRILAESGVSKMTMYKYFKTKDDLIIAALNHAHNSFVENILNNISATKISPKAKIIKLFDTLQNFTKEQDVVRCVFINASAEFPDLNNPIHQAATQHKLSMEKFVFDLLKEMKAKNPKHTARVITTLLQGSLVLAQIVDDKSYYSNSKKVIKDILN